MRRPKKEYGSEYRLWQYFYGVRRAELETAILKAIGLPDHSLRWLYPDEANAPGQHEFENLDFLSTSEFAEVLAEFKTRWPTTGTGISWDGIAWSEGTPRRLILIEAKTNQPELCSSPSGAGEPSLKMISSALGRTKSILRVHHRFSWTKSYYQYANRLFVLSFLERKLDCHLVFLYFIGEKFPDGTPCPRNPEEWRELIRTCHLSLGLASPGEADKLWAHELGKRVHEIFLPVSPDY
jgi:hypothetical protein